MKWNKRSGLNVMESIVHYEIGNSIQRFTKSYFGFLTFNARFNFNPDELVSYLDERGITSIIYQISIIDNKYKAMIICDVKTVVNRPISLIIYEKFSDFIDKITITGNYSYGVINSSDSNSDVLNSVWEESRYFIKRYTANDYNEIYNIPSNIDNRCLTKKYDINNGIGIDKDGTLRFRKGFLRQVFKECQLKEGAKIYVQVIDVNGSLIINFENNHGMKMAIARRGTDRVIPTKKLFDEMNIDYKNYDIKYTVEQKTSFMILGVASVRRK